MSACADCESIVICHPTCLLRTHGTMRDPTPRVRRKLKASGRTPTCEGCGKTFRDKNPLYIPAQSYCSKACQVRKAKTQVWVREVAREGFADE